VEAIMGRDEKKNLYLRIYVVKFVVNINRIFLMDTFE